MELLDAAAAPIDGEPAAQLARRLRTARDRSCRAAGSSRPSSPARGTSPETHRRPRGGRAPRCGKDRAPSGPCRSTKIRNASCPLASSRSKALEQVAVGQRAKCAGVEQGIKRPPARPRLACRHRSLRPQSSRPIAIHSRQSYCAVRWSILTKKAMIHQAPTIGPELPMAADTDRQLLFGLIALQVGLIDQAQLVAAFQASAHDKTRPLADHLCDRGSLGIDSRARSRRWRPCT